jgi:glucose-1-phosphate adenylyltransferase
MNDVVALVMAGGMGERLRPLTDVRAKPAVHFGAAYRIIDFTLSNCVNSHVSRIFVLTQYKSHSLSNHLKNGWNFYSRRLNQFIDEIPAQMQKGNQWYKGTADAIRQNMNLVDECKPAHVLVLSGDHIYKMDYRLMRHWHEERQAGLTIAAIRVPVELARDNYGVLEADENGRIIGFEEKPSRPKTIPGSEDCLASMGLYIFTTPVLRTSLANELDDFGMHIIPKMIAQGDPVYAYDFSTRNTIEEYEYEIVNGIRIKHRVERAIDSDYWRDVGSLDAYWAASLDLVSAAPKFNLYGEMWPIFNTPVIYPPAKFVHDSPGRTGLAVNSIVSDGVIISGSIVRRSILGPGVYIHSYSEIENSVLMGGSRVGGILFDTTIGRGCRIKNAIIDKCSYLHEGFILGFDRSADEANGFTCVSIPDSGDHIVVVPRDYGMNHDLMDGLPLA